MVKIDLLSQTSKQEFNKPLEFPGFDHISSNGYVSMLIREYRKQWGKKHNCKPEFLEIKTETFGLGKELQEVSLVRNGLKMITFARAYGFRAVKKIVQKIKWHTRAKKPIKCPYVFIEMMACPKGCVHGNGQIKSYNKELTQFLAEKVLKLLSTKDKKVEMDLYSERLNEIFQNDSYPSKFLITRFKPVEKDQNISILKW